MDVEQRSFASDTVTDRDLDDLIHSWERLDDPASRRLAVRLIRLLGEDQGGAGPVRRGVTSRMSVMDPDPPPPDPAY